MKKKLVILLAMVLVASNCLYVSAAPLSDVKDGTSEITSEGFYDNSENDSQENSEEPSEEETEDHSEKKDSGEDESEQTSEEETSEKKESKEDNSEETSEKTSEDTSEENSEDTSEKLSENTSEITSEELLPDEIDETEDGELTDSYNGFEYTVSGSTVTITKYTGTATSVQIPDKFAGKTVTTIGKEAFSANMTMTSLSIPSTVTTIGQGAFNNCQKMTSLTLSEGLQSIGIQAFKGCIALKTLVIPSTVSSVGSSAFERCDSLTSVTIKGTYVGAFMFYDCKSLTSIRIPSQVIFIGNGACKGCSSLTSATIEANAAIGNNVFDGCEALTTVNLSNLSKIGYAMFARTGISSVTIPASVKEIDKQAFAECKKLTSVSMNEGVTSIQTKAFYNCTGLKEITLPSTLSVASNEVFRGCSSLTKVNLKGGIVGSYMFQDCTSLTEITIPAKVYWIGDYAFKGCTKLKKAVIQSSGTIATYVFEGCTNLTEINLQNATVESIQEGAFKNTGVTEIVIPKTVKVFGGSVFYGCKSLKAVDVQGSTIGVSMFEGCTALTNVVFPETVTTFGNRAFYGCSNLKTAQFLGNAPSSFGSDVFGAVKSGFEIQFFEGKSGWTTPKWNGYNTKKISKMSGDVATIFKDVHTGQWYVSGIQYVYDKGLMVGKSATEFGINSNVQREQVVVTLYAAAGKPAVSGSSKFPDVKQGVYYEKAVIWATNNKITSGLGDGSFGVGNSISRESLAMMLYGYAKMKNIKTNVTAGASNGYADTKDISSYAKTAMDWAVTQGILSGKGSGSKAQMRLDPKGKATRAEFATMIMKLLK